MDTKKKKNDSSKNKKNSIPQSSYRNDQPISIILRIMIMIANLTIISTYLTDISIQKSILISETI
jgi:hypothetical protein